MPRNFAKAETGVRYAFFGSKDSTTNGRSYVTPTSPVQITIMFSSIQFPLTLLYIHQYTM